jgi:hypothetical protein
MRVTSIGVEPGKMPGNTSYSFLDTPLFEADRPDRGKCRRTGDRVSV